MSRSKPLIAVVGGGITGLAAAWHLAREGGVRVALVESSARLGGIIQTRQIEGALVEQGPDAILDSALIRELIELLGLSAEIVEPAVFGALIAIDGTLRPLPRSTVLGVPLRPRDAMKARLLSPIAAARCWSESLWRRPLTGPDTAVGPFVAHRFGTAVLDRMVDPLLAGARAGDAGRLSLAGAFPQLDKAAREHRSALRGLRAQRRSPSSFISFQGGLSTLVRALTPRHDAEILLRHKVRKIRPGRRGFDLEGTGLSPHGVVVASPAHAAARLLEGWPGASQALGSIEHASLVVASLLLEGTEADLPGPGSGILVPSQEGRLLSACSFLSRKWPDLAGNANIVRAVAGRAGHPAFMNAPANELALALDEEVRGVTGHKLRLIRSVVRKLPGSLPQYTIGHHQRVADALSALPPGVSAAGAWVGGTGIPDCIAAGRAAADRVLADVLG